MASCDMKRPVSERRVRALHPSCVPPVIPLSLALPRPGVMDATSTCAQARAVKNAAWRARRLMLPNPGLRLLFGPR